VSCTCSPIKLSQSQFTSRYAQNHSNTCYKSSQDHLLTKFRNSKMRQELRRECPAIVKYENLVGADNDKDDTARFHKIGYNTLALGKT